MWSAAPDQLGVRSSRWCVHYITWVDVMMAAGKQGNNGVVPGSYTCEVKSPVRHLAGSLLKQNKIKNPQVGLQEGQNCG